MTRKSVTVDIDGVGLKTPAAKSKLIETSHPNWRDLLAESFAKDIVAMGKAVGINVTFNDAYNEGRRFADGQPYFPLFLTDRYNCAPIIGKDAYEGISQAVYKMDIPLIDGFREGLTAMVNDGIGVSLMTHRRADDFDTAARTMKEGGVWELFRGEYYLVRGSDSKISYSLNRKKNGHIDDEARCLIGDAPKDFAKVLVQVALNQARDFDIVRIDENGPPVAVWPLMRRQNIQYVVGFNPYAKDALMKVWHK